MMVFQSIGLGGGCFDFQISGEGVGDGGLGPTLRRFQTAGAEAERVPVETQATPGHEQDRYDSRRQQSPA